jgi:hypothetical protein
MKLSEDIQFPLTLILSHKVRGNDREMVLPPGERKKRKKWEKARMRMYVQDMI